jgi:hypothetical protein
MGSDSFFSPGEEAKQATGSLSVRENTIFCRGQCPFSTGAGTPVNDENYVRDERLYLFDICSQR